jgi:YesN/AraC family two-component response regulator
MMPIMDGITFCANLRKDFETCHIPIILLTAHTSLKNNIEGMDMGADDYISKPFSIELLKARCENLLENRKMLRQKFEKDFTGVDDLVKTGADKKFISSVIDVINANLFSQNLNVNMLCQELNISRTLLDKKLKGITGSSPREFIENIKLKQAARLLKDSDMNVSEIAYELGYSSPKYFTLRFKKMFGVTPTDYKK